MVLNVESALAAAKAKLPNCLATVQKNSVFFASACITISHVKGDIVEVNINAKGECITQDDHVEVEPPVNFVKEMKLGDFAAQLLSFAKDNHHADGLNFHMLKEIQTPEFESFIVESSVIQVCLYALECLMYEKKCKSLKARVNKVEPKISSTYGYALFTGANKLRFKKIKGAGLEVEFISLNNGHVDIKVTSGDNVIETHDISSFTLMQSCAQYIYIKEDMYTATDVQSMCRKYLSKKHDVVDIFKNTQPSLEMVCSLMTLLERKGNLIVANVVAA